MKKHETKADVETRRNEYIDKQRNEALTKALIYFKDGNKSIFYSLDSKADKSAKDIWKGFEGLKRRLIEGKFKGQHKTALVYINQPDNKGQLIAEWVDGIRIR